MSASSMDFGGDSVDLSATIFVYDSISTVVFRYSVNGGIWNDTTGSDNGDGTWSGVATSLADLDEVDWYITVTSASGVIMTKPVSAPAYFNSFTVTEMPDPGDGPAHLLFTEVCVKGSSHEFVEIFNPTDEVVSLENYYLTDAIYATGSQYYWRITEGNPSQSTIGGGAYSDFHARFPADMEIQPRQAISIALRDSDDFVSSFGIQPDLELFDTGDGSDNIPEMLEVFDGSNTISEEPYDSFLTNGGEVVILYYWDSESPIVTDIDIFRWYESESPSSTFFVKSSVPGYLPDTPVVNQESYVGAHNIGSSFVRIDPTEGTETKTGGNGSEGNDETSENLTATWMIDEASPGYFFILDPDAVPAGITLNVEPAPFLPRMSELLPISITIEIPEDENYGFETLVRIFDMEGRVIRSLFDSRFDGSVSAYVEMPTSVDWDGRNDTYEIMPAGMYIVHMSVVNTVTGEQTTLTAPAVVATRLGG